MKAAVLHGVGRSLAIEDVPEPNLGPDEVLIETHTCGICRTDLHIQDGLAYVPNLPHVMGHEPAGIAVRAGHDVDDSIIGRRVVPHLFVARRECSFTRRGQHAQATHLEGIIGVTMPGGFAEYFVAPERNLLTLPDNVPFDVGGLTSCAVITAVHAYRKSALEANDTAVVLGAGGIGLLIIQLLAKEGVRTVAVSRSAVSLELATQAGAELALSIDSPETTGRIRQFAGGENEGVDCVFEMVGRADTMNAAASFAARGGRIIVIGEEPEQPAIDTITIAQRELQIIGSRNGGHQDAIDSLAMMSSGVIRPRIAGRYPLDEINEAFGHVRSGEAHGRVIVTVKDST